MAHVTIEWTANLADRFDLRALMEMIAEDMRERADGVFPVGGIRVCQFRREDGRGPFGRIPQGLLHRTVRAD
jgi:5-carboxymethyl-2-hydroxymuconate isomerase